MKKFKVIAVLAIAFCFLFGTTAVYGYGYGISVSGGNGSIDGGDVSATSVTFVSGDIATVNGNNVTPPPGDKYFATGLKLAGHDNEEVFDETANLDVANSDSLIYQQDTELVVAYGLKSNMVKYTISYVDQNGADLLPSETHYGVIDQKPIVSYKHVAGYLPQAYNLKKTLTDNVADNVFTFTYSPAQAAEGNTTIVYDGAANAAGGNAAGNAAAGNAAGNAAAAPGTATIGDNQTPLAVEDQDTPLAANPDEEEGGGPGAFPFIIGGVIAAGIIAAIAAILARRKGDEVE